MAEGAAEPAVRREGENLPGDENLLPLLHRRRFAPSSRPEVSADLATFFSKVSALSARAFVLHSRHLPAPRAERGVSVKGP
ncbi:MAG: hypothetical protein ACE5LX_10320, partial [Nitrospinota bacterium]